ncbi:hypothetical protein ACH4U7_48395 [Streptomyces sp. NPDC020845]|uniref:hypothetical protein n=1 Tax=Streptomyces sp. NPDC020845 TaxID=3365096 RepID=UPI00379D73D7
MTPLKAKAQAGFAALDCIPCPFKPQCTTSTIRQATAVTGTRRARYRGLAKTHLEHIYSAVALNLIRLNAWWNDRPLDRTRTSHLTRLEHTLTA